ncbi:MAG TPA: TolC family protein [Candidatus Acidoferrum sp.]|nr:TolC family protein [Candidatus Acidoferrum sp.]
MRQGMAWAGALLALPGCLLAQQNPPTAPVSSPLPPSAAPQSPSARITIDEAIRLALQHNHALQAARTTILQNQAQEITANLRPNPVLSWDAQFLPIFQPSKFDADYINTQSQFDLGIGYTFERGKKRQHRLQAAKDQTTVTRSQVADNERQLVFNVSQQFIDVVLAQSTIDFAKQDLESFQKTVDISEARYKAGDMSEGDFLKIKLQLLQFQTDYSSAVLAKVQAIAALRQLVGFESVPDFFDVQGQLDYLPVHAGLEDLRALAMRTRPDLLAAQQGVTAARSQELLAEANGKRDLGASFNYSHVAATNTGAFFFNIQLPIFDRNQGEIARTRYAITQSQEVAIEASEQVMSDVVDAFEALRTNDQIVQLYRGGYVDAAKKSRDISEYAYQKGAASLLDFLDAERSYRANQLAYRQALASYMTALEQMRQAVGTRDLP